MCSSWELLLQFIGNTMMVFVAPAGGKAENEPDKSENACCKNGIANHPEPFESDNVWLLHKLHGPGLP
jgi:hypothetical protein